MERRARSPYNAVMNDAALRTILCGLLLFASGAAARTRREAAPSVLSLSGKSLDSILFVWPEDSRRLARLMIAEYGPPDGATDDKLVWFDNGPWKKTVVRGRGKGRLEQSVAYRVASDGSGALAGFEGEVAADAKAGLLTARSGDESVNFLDLNLADDVLQGRRAPKDASARRREVLRLREAGRCEPYLTGLAFVHSEEYARPAAARRRSGG